MSEKNMPSRRDFLAGAAGGAATLLGGAPGAKALSPGGPGPLETPPGASSGRGPERRPNIILITTDEHRWDALGAAGHPVLKTPHLDRLAASGTRFSNAFCQGPLCQPSRASLLTGRHVHEHGVVANSLNMDPNWDTLPKRLQQAGYRTAIIGKTHFYGRPGQASPDLQDMADFVRGFGFDDVLEEFDKQVHRNYPGSITPYTQYLKERGLFEAYLDETPLFGRGAPVEGQYTGKTSRIPAEHDLTSFVGGQAVSWLKNAPTDQPFFLWTSFIAPHPPFISDSGWTAYYQDKPVKLGPSARPGPAPGPWGVYTNGLLRAYKTHQITPQLAEGAARHYFAMISLIDEQIGRLLDTLKARGQADNTWIVFTADHGEMLGDHGFMFKSLFYRGSVMVPFIIRPAGGVEPRVVNDPVENLDLTATLAQAAGVGGAYSGRSLAPYFTGGAVKRPYVLSELAGFRRLGAHFVMIMDGRWRYTYDARNQAPCELFDLERDPDELNNLVMDPDAQKTRNQFHAEHLAPLLAKEEFKARLAGVQ